jgi:N-formylglutamate amidohydrolase
MKPLTALLILQALGPIAAATPAATETSCQLQSGNAPVVICVPHGGRLKPVHVANRRLGVVGEDANTDDLGRRLAEAIRQQSGRSPTLLHCLWHRSKVDMNRELTEAAQGDEHAEAAWQRYHQLAQQAIREALATHGRILLIDLHGQSHPQNRVELGYLHDAADYHAGRQLKPQGGSAAILATLHPSLNYDAFLRGPLSLGALLEQQGFQATPSPREPAPTLPYFRGGYTLRRHTLANPGVLGVQIEANRLRLRDTHESRQRFAQALASVLPQYLAHWLKLPAP